ncbi:MAG: YlxR family protein [Quinella sp. 2Q5]|nr:YlxR family protein [Quinella sp. 2Q5]
MARGKSAKGTAIKPIEMRRCVACRSVRHKSELVRMVKSNDEIFIDTAGKVEGRGAYVCRSAECVQALRKRRGLEKTFKLKVPNEFYEMLKETVLM